MASFSSAAAAEACIYDVFLSFRGEDTRHSFTDHLYHRLKRAGIHTFRDDDEANRGEELKPGLETAIKASKASIVVLSENYAASTWCLDELMLILKQRRENNHFVLPVFYHVEPTDVRNQTGSFVVEVKPSSRWTYDNVYMWKRALVEVANLSGFTLSGHETGILKKVVERAIKASKASIVVLSENYAASTWCLDELVLILKQRRENNQFVLPVFYHVEPTDVRNQTGSFAIEVKPASRWTYDNVNKWKTALVEVANLSGFRPRLFSLRELRLNLNTTSEY